MKASPQNWARFSTAQTIFDVPLPICKTREPAEFQADESWALRIELHTEPPISESSTGLLLLMFGVSMTEVWEMESDSDELARLSRLGICPNCARQIPEGTAVVRAGGSFCSLNCVASYFEAEFKERARRLDIASRQ
jgi:hypothetical protein